MRVLVTGSAGHLGEALVRTGQNTSHEVVGLDIVASNFTSKVGSIVDRSCVKRCMKGVDAVLHTASLHKPHVITHSRQDFVDTNITGTLNLLEEAASAGVQSFVFTSTTSAFGGALTPPAGAPAVWVTEDVTSVPKNIYGVTKTAAEDLLRALPPGSWPGLPHLENFAVFSGRGRLRGDAASVRRLQCQSERISLPSCRSRGRRKRPFDCP